MNDQAYATNIRIVRAEWASAKLDDLVDTSEAEAWYESGTVNDLLTGYAMDGLLDHEYLMVLHDDADIPVFTGKTGREFPISYDFTDDPAMMDLVEKTITQEAAANALALGCDRFVVWCNPEGDDKLRVYDLSTMIQYAPGLIRE